MVESERNCGKYRIEVDGKTFYATSDSLEQKRAELVAANRGKFVEIFVYAQVDPGVDVASRYIVSSYATAVAKEVEGRLQRAEEAAAEARRRLQRAEETE